MNIVIMGAGAIGSLFGALLSKKNNVMLIGRTSHVKTIRKNGLNIEDKTQLNVKIPAEDSIDKVTLSPDVLILTVKSFDTISAINQAMKIIDDDTIILTLQNGLDNIDMIEKVVDSKQIIAGITTHGAFFSKPGVIGHTGKGKTTLGKLNGKKTGRIKHIADLFNEVGIETIVSEDIIKEMWVKAIVNSSINPLTTFFQCKNGYLLENPILEKIVEKVCKESTSIAKANGINLLNQHTIQKTKEIIRNTSENHSSMLQSFKKGKKTEIDSINGKIVEIGKKHDIEPMINEVLVYLIESICLE
ncbi:ketopantoate reductase [Thermoplasmatales archaeon SCGC AB-540-F20]|nr:ketopantoate reductase [Thermoplasmatales archaeon SCGC AB-540-F20]